MRVKPELIQKYKEYLIKNVIENAGVERKGGEIPLAYSMEILTCTELVGIALDEGKTPEEAMNETNGRNITGFMAGAVASAIAMYHFRGDEFKKWWNESWGRPSAEGVVNPAIMTLKTKRND